MTYYSANIDYLFSQDLKKVGIDYLYLFSQDKFHPFQAFCRLLAIIRDQKEQFYLTRSAL